MEHVVFYAASEGPAFRRVGSLAEAVALVESLRNEHGVEDLSVHALTPVPMSFRAYYRVEVPAGGEPVAAEEVHPEGLHVEGLHAEGLHAEGLHPDPMQVEVPPQGRSVEAAPVPAVAAAPDVPAVAAAPDVPAVAGPSDGAEPVHDAEPEELLVAEAAGRPLVLADAPAAPTVLPEAPAAVGDLHRPRGLGRFAR